VATKKSAGGNTEVRIGISDSNQELHIEVEGAAEDVIALVNAAVDAGKVLKLTDTKGRQTLVPAAKIGFVEVGPAPERRVGFASN
jgi:N-acyl-D-aspartate/D-glutamate deacylase